MYAFVIYHALFLHAHLTSEVIYNLKNNNKKKKKKKKKKKHSKAKYYYRKIAQKWPSFDRSLNNLFLLYIS